MAKPKSDDEILRIYKDIDKKIKDKTVNPELTGSYTAKDYADNNISDDDIPLLLGQKEGDRSETNILGGLTAQKLAYYLQKNEEERFRRFERYKKIESALIHPEIDGALNIYADEVCTEDMDGRIIHILSKNEKVKDVLEEMIARTGIEKKIWLITKNLCAFGEDFSEVVVSQNQKQIIGIQRVPKELIERIEKDTRLMGFKPRKLSAEEQTLQDKLNLTYTYKFNDEKEKKDNLIMPFRILHWKIPSSKYGIYGESILESVLGVIESLKLMEKAMLIARISRAPERRVYYINVGNLQGEQAVQYARKAVETGLKKKRVLDIFDNNKVDMVRDVFGASEDIIIPIRNPEDAKIDTLPAANNLGQIDDLVFLRDRLFPGLGIPRQYFFDETFQAANTNLSSKNVPFSKKIRRIQRFDIDQITKLCIIELKLKGMAKAINEFQVVMNNPSSINETELLNIDTLKWGLIASIKSQNATAVFYPDYYIYKDILKLSDNEIVELIKLNQLQQAGANIFDAFAPEDRPEGAKDLNTQQAVPQPQGAGGAGGAPPPMGGAGAPPVGAGEVPPDAAGALGAPPQGGGGPQAAPEVPQPGGQAQTASADEIDSEKEVVTEDAKAKALRKKAELLKKNSEKMIQHIKERKLNEDVPDEEAEKTYLKKFTTSVTDNKKYFLFAGELTGLLEEKDFDAASDNDAAEEDKQVYT